VQKRDYYASTAKIKITWYKNTINPNDAIYVERQAMNEISVQIPNAIDVTR